MRLTGLAEMRSLTVLALFASGDGAEASAVLDDGRFMARLVRGLKGQPSLFSSFGYTLALAAGTAGAGADILGPRRVAAALAAPSLGLIPILANLQLDPVATDAHRVSAAALLNAIACAGGERAAAAVSDALTSARGSCEAMLASLRGGLGWGRHHVTELLGAVARCGGQQAARAVAA